MGAVPHFQAHLQASSKQRKKIECDLTPPLAEQEKLPEETVATSRPQEKAARKMGSGCSGQEGEAGQREERGRLEKQVKATAP